MWLKNVWKLRHRRPNRLRASYRVHTPKTMYRLSSYSVRTHAFLANEWRPLSSNLWLISMGITSYKRRFSSKLSGLSRSNFLKGSNRGRTTCCRQNTDQKCFKSWEQPIPESSEEHPYQNAPTKRNLNLIYRVNHKGNKTARPRLKRSATKKLSELRQHDL